MKLNYFNIQKFCLHDGPGIRTTVFLKGCPLRCAWCHNPESHNVFPELLFAAHKCTSCGLCVGYCDARSIDPESGRMIFARGKCTACGKCVTVCPQHANSLKGKTAETSEILEAVLRDKHFYDTSGGGMTVSGGEPAMQPEGVLELISAARDHGVRSAMETCGIGAPDFYRAAADLGCLFLYDIKGVDDDRHAKNTTVSNERIRENLDMLLDLGAQVIIRAPLIPGFNTDRADLEGLRDFLARRANKLIRCEIMPYHNLGVQKRRNLGIEADDSIPDGRQFAGEWREILAGSGVTVRVSGE